ncbi:MAG: spore germination protein [Clostridiales bacterium]|nr:spore germination protein [Clostridiales bacterium]
MNLSTNLDDNIKRLHEIFPIEKSYDLVTRTFYLRDTKAYWMGINGLCDNGILQKLFSDLQNPLFTQDAEINDLPKFMASKIGYVQAELCEDWDKIIKNILSGPSVLFVDGFSQAVVLDSRKYPVRGIEEPDLEKVSRGAKDGFVETIVYNTALIRRRIRNPKLSFEMLTVGTESKSDVAIAYIDGSIDTKLLETLKQKINSLNIPALTMGPQSLQELIIKKRWWNPLPQTRYTQRPDVACSYILEGYITIIVDNFPSVMIFPCTLFQFTQNPEDYYQNPSVGNYLRLLRFFCILASLFIMPVFLLLGMYANRLPASLQVITTEAVNPTKLFIFVIIVEVFLDIFKYSSSNASSGLSNSLGLVGGLIIGDVAIKLNWATTEVLFYGAATMLCTLSIAAQEFAQAIRLYRYVLVLMTGFFGLTGFILAIILVLISIVTTPSISGKNYLWPLIPFRWSALKTLLFRYPTAKYQEKH